MTHVVLFDMRGLVPHLSCSCGWQAEGNQWADHATLDRMVRAHLPDEPWRMERGDDAGT